MKDAVGQALMDMSRKILLLEAENAELKGDAERYQKENAALHKALNPRFWSSAIDNAWHTNIPDTHKAFEAITNAALIDAGFSPMHIYAKDSNG